MIKNKKILIIGGAGYVGSELVKYLLSKNYNITVFDLMIYGDNLDENENLKKIKGDVRDINKINQLMRDSNIVIHLACISNDPSFELNPLLGKSINLDSFEPIVISAQKNNIEKFIFASSSSVYGVKKEKNVIEDMSLEPLTDYSKYKVECENILKKYFSKNFITSIVRPATVCGYSSRQRLDVVVNILTNLAYHKREITVFGGEQLRPNINIKDMVRAYDHILNAKSDIINGQIFNVGSENYSVEQIGNLVKKVVGGDVTFKIEETNDKRSYHVSSQKIKDILDFNIEFTIEDASKSLVSAFEKNLLKDPLNNEMYFNIKRMQNINLK